MSARGEATTTLPSRTGRPLSPADVVALLAPHGPTDDPCAALGRAVRSGYRVEKA